MKKTYTPVRFVASAALLASIVSLADAQILSNGTGGGDFSASSTWAGGVVPTGPFQVVASDAVVGNTGLNFVSSSNSSVLGQLTVNTGASINMGRLNNTLVVSNSIINVSGGNLSVSRVASATGSTNNLINISAGKFTVRDAAAIPAHYTINVSGTGVMESAGSIGTQVNLDGGTLIFSGIAHKTSGAIAWNTGTVIMGSGAAHNINDSNNVFNGWISNDANVLAFSNQTTKQTVTIGTGTSNPTLAGGQGTMSFNIYSSTDNDNDQLAFAGTSGLSLTSGVDIRLNGLSLTGTASDFLGQTYKLFNITSGNYSDLNPTISSTVWNIGGEEFEVGWTNNLALDGSLTISTLTATAIPEPGTFAALTGLATLGLTACTRKRP